MSASNQKNKTWKYAGHLISEDQVSFECAEAYVYIETHAVMHDMFAMMVAAGDRAGDVSGPRDSNPFGVSGKIGEMVMDFTEERFSHFWDALYKHGTPKVVILKDNVKGIAKGTIIAVEFERNFVPDGGE